MQTSTKILIGGTALGLLGLGLAWYFTRPEPMPPMRGGGEAQTPVFQGGAAAPQAYAPATSGTSAPAPAPAPIPINPADFEDSQVAKLDGGGLTTAFIAKKLLHVKL